MGEFWEKWWPTVLGVVLLTGAAFLLWPDQRPSVDAEADVPIATAGPTVPAISAPTQTDQEIARRQSLEDAERRAMLREAESQPEPERPADSDSALGPTTTGDGDRTKQVRLTEDSPEVRSALGKVEVELYETSWCKYCKKTRAFLDRSGVSYRAYDIEADSSAKLRKEQLSPARGVPLTVVDGRIISGYSESELNSAFQAAVGQRLSAR